MSRLALFLFTGLLAVSSTSNSAGSSSSEALGQFRFTELQLSPRLRVEEPGQSGFEIEQSYLGLEWTRNEDLRAGLRWGTPDLLRTAVWYLPQTSNPGFTEAWLEVRGESLDVKAGLLGIPIGFEGVFASQNSYLPESRVRRKGWIQQSDYGLQFNWETRPWSTSLTVHNGETGPNLDRWMWVTGMWKFHRTDEPGVLITASVGNTRVESTATATRATSENFLWNPNDSSKIRTVVLSFFQVTRRSYWVLEGGRGEIVQANTKGPYAWGRFDGSLAAGENLNFLFRYEQNQSHLNDSQTIVKSGGLGLAVTSKDRLQSLSFFGSRVSETPEIMNDEFWLIFRLNSTLLR